MNAPNGSTGSLRTPALGNAESGVVAGRPGQAFSDGSNARERAGQLPVLLQYWRVVQRRRWLILAILALSLLIGLVVTLLMTPRYTASSTIEISRQQDRIVQVQDVRPDNGQVDAEFYQTQYSLLTARSLAEHVAENLKLVDDDNFFSIMRVKLSGDGLFSASTKRRLTEAEPGRAFAQGRRRPQEAGSRRTGAWITAGGGQLDLAQPRAVAAGDQRMGPAVHRFESCSAV